MSQAEQDVISIGHLQIRYLLDGAADGTAGMFELTVLPGAKSPPAHTHDGEEIIYGLEGTLRVVVGGEVSDLAPGQSSYTPRGVEHGFSNPYAAPARVLVINTPDIGAQYFRDVAEVARSPGGLNPARMAELMRRYGLTLVAPKADTPASA